MPVKSMTIPVPTTHPAALARPIRRLAQLAWAGKVCALTLVLAAFETAIAKMRVFRVPEFLGVAILLGLLAAVFLFVSTGFAGYAGSGN